MLEFLTSKLDYLNPFKVVPALSEAIKNARETKDAGFLAKIGIFFSSFSKAMKGEKKKEEDAKREAEKGVEHNLDEEIKKLDLAIGLKDVTKEERDRHEEVKLFAIKGFSNIHSSKRESAYKGLEKFNKSVKGESADLLNFDEAGCLAAVGLTTLGELKKKYPKKDDFKKALNDFSTISNKSNYPLTKILSMSTLAIFKVDIGGTIMNPANWGKKAEALDFLRRFGMDKDDADLLADLKNSPMENKAAVVSVFRKNLFPNSSDVDDIVDKINDLVVNAPDPLDTESLSDLIFLIDDKDYDNLVKILSGNS